MQTTASVKGQIVIPATLRKRFGITAGTRIAVEVSPDQEGILLKPVTSQYVKRLCGRYQGYPLLKSLKAMKQEEKQR